MGSAKGGGGKASKRSSEEGVVVMRWGLESADCTVD